MIIYLLAYPIIAVKHKVSAITYETARVLHNTKVICKRYLEEKPENLNRVESPLAGTPSHTTVQALSHTAVLDLYFTNSSRRENNPIPLNQFKLSAL